MAFRSLKNSIDILYARVGIEGGSPPRLFMAKLRVVVEPDEVSLGEDNRSVSQKLISHRSDLYCGMFVLVGHTGKKLR
jgi:hypothetical protein